MRWDLVGIIEKRISDQEDPVRLNTYGVFVNLARDIKGRFQDIALDIVLKVYCNRKFRDGQLQLG